MLPFSSIDFFIVAALMITYLFVAKYLLKNLISYSTNVLVVNIFFLVLFFPRPWQVIVFIIYSYGITYLFTGIFKIKNKLLGCFFLLMPMISIKSYQHWNIHHDPVLDLISFAGLSYISFRIISVYMDSVPGSKPVNFFDYTGFLTFIPSLLIGPIDRYPRFKKDIDEGYVRINSKNFVDGWQLLMIGVLYKYICAEVIDRYWLSLISSDSKTIQDAASTMYGYFFYLFFDFAGYSSMAIGIGKMMGIDLPINFYLPFIARNPSDFWKRFHKSLGDWLSDYFFKPFYLYFSRKKSLKPYPLFRQNIALFATFLLMGCWNGFKWQYIISGMLFGIYSVVYNSYNHLCKKNGRDIVFGKMNPTVVTWISIFITFHLAAFSIYIFSGRSHLL